MARPPARSDIRRSSLAASPTRPISPAQPPAGTPEPVAAPVDATAAAPSQTPTEAPATPTVRDTQEVAPTPKRRAARVPEGRKRIAARMPVECFAMLRDAWWSDLDHGGDHAAPSQGEWLGRALLDYTALPLAERQRVAADLPDWSGSELQARSWNVAGEVRAAIVDTMTDDRKAGQVTSQTSLIIEAIVHGHAAATARRGGTIPPAPADRLNRVLLS